MARPPVSTARPAAQSDGRLRDPLERRWRDGTTHVVFEPGKLLERLVALIPPPRARRLLWFALMQGVFARDVLECPSCRGRMRVIAAIEQPEIAAAILGSLGLASRAPPGTPARQPELFCDPDFELAGPADDLTEPPVRLTPVTGLTQPERAPHRRPRPSRPAHRARSLAA